MAGTPVALGALAAYGVQEAARGARPELSIEEETMRPVRLAAAALAFTALLAPTAHGQSDSSGPAQRSIGVVGEAVLRAPNDRVSFGFGVEARRRTAPRALSGASAQARRVLAALQAGGVQRQDLRTEEVSVSRILSRPVRRGAPRRVIGYRATTTVSAVSREVARAGALLTAAVRAGATSVDGPSFSLSNRRELGRRALTAAFEDARMRAQALATAAGVTLGPVISVREGSGGSEEFAAQRDAASGERSRRRSAPIRPGSSEVESSVSVVFAIS